MVCSTDGSVTAIENAVSAGLGLLLVAGVYADGWAHLNVGGLDTFFTPWHGLLYGAFGLLAAWTVWLVIRHRPAIAGWRCRVPKGYGRGVAGIAIFAAGGFLDLGWHLVFGIETGLDALISPTHLLLLLGGTLLLTSPVRATPVDDPLGRWTSTVALAAATALAAFFLSYLSVFVDPLARVPLITLPETDPGHHPAELPAVAGMGGYLVSTIVLVAPIAFLRRHGRIPVGAVTVVVAAVAVPGAALTEFAFLPAALTAVAGAVLVDLVLAVRPGLGPVALAGLLPVLIWSGQLAGLMAGAELRWPPQLWAGAVVLTAALGATTVWLTAGTARASLPVPASPPPGRKPADHSAPPALPGHDRGGGAHPFPGEIP